MKKMTMTTKSDWELATGSTISVGLSRLSSHKHIFRSIGSTRYPKLPQSVLAPWHTYDVDFYRYSSSLLASCLSPRQR